jgi:hypothetical protein
MRHTKNKKDTIGNLLASQWEWECDDSFHYHVLG